MGIVSPAFRAIPHNSKCRYGERGVAAAKPKAQIILDAAKVSAASGGNSEQKQGQRSQSARGFCPRSTMRVPQPDIIEHFGNADVVPQLPERCLSRKAGIVRCCPNCGLQKLAPRAVRHLFVAVIASIISYASRVSTDILTNIMQASLRCCSRFFFAAFPSHPSSLHPGIPAHLPSFSPIIPRSI